MKRLLATIHCDVLVQYRNGFYYAAGFLLLIWAVLIYYAPDVDWDVLLPALIFGNLSIATFYFIAGLVLLEKGEGTAVAQLVSPLRSTEYLLAKVLSLAALSMAENLAIVLLAYGYRFEWLAMTLGIFFAAAIYSLSGFLAVVRYQSINEYLFPSIPYILVLSLPFLPYFGVWWNPVAYLHPLYSSLLLMKAAFRPIHMAEWIYAVFYSALWIAALLHFCARAFRRRLAEQGNV